jgi:hypothetical protein
MEDSARRGAPCPSVTTANPSGQKCRDSITVARAMKSITRFYPAAAVVVVWAGCNARDAEPQRSDTTDAPTASVAAAPLVVEHFDTLKLERGVCFGTCPVYRITVYGDGRFLYEGERFVKVKDTVTGSLDPLQVRALDTAIARVAYFSLRDGYFGDECPAIMSDFPWVTTSVTIAGRTKRIEHDHGCIEKHARNTNPHTYPRGLTRFEEEVDSIIGTSRWVGTDEERREIDF